MRIVAVVGAFALIGWACGSSSITAPSASSQVSSNPTPAPTPAPVGPTAIAFHVYGFVTNDEGTPIDGATVTLSYQPDLGAGQTVSTRTGADGRYELLLNARQPGNVNALVRATRGDELAPTEQFVRVAASAVKNLRMRPIWPITVGQSATLQFDSESSRCASLGIAGLCEWVRIKYASTFTEMLTIRASGETASVAPTLRAFVPDPIFSINAPHVPPPMLVVGQGSVTFQAGDEEWSANYYPRTADVVVTIPAEAVPQRIEVNVY